METCRRGDREKHPPVVRTTKKRRTHAFRRRARMSSSKYPYVLATQLSILLVDVFFNTLSVLFYGSNMLLLLIYILQDTLLIMASLVLFVSFTATFVFQLGLIHIIILTFLPTILISLAYTFTSIGFHYTSLSTTWEDQNVNIFLETPILVFFVLHKLLACFFYSYYKRTALQISDPKYNSDSTWLRELFLKHMERKGTVKREVAAQ